MLTIQPPTSSHAQAELILPGGKDSMKKNEIFRIHKNTTQESNWLLHFAFITFLLEGEHVQRPRVHSD